MVSYNDPYVPVLPTMRHHTIKLKSQALTAEFLNCSGLRGDRHRPHGRRLRIRLSRQPAGDRHAQFLTNGITHPDCQIVKA